MNALTDHIIIIIIIIDRITNLKNRSINHIISLIFTFDKNLIGYTRHLIVCDMIQECFLYIFKSKE